MIAPRFDPFRDRLSRDIRNALSASLPDCIEQASVSPAAAVASAFAPETLETCYRNYIEQRLDNYALAISTAEETATTEPVALSVILWDLELFFEVHEILEHAWLKSRGEEKLLLQALIRAAGVYIKLEAESPDAARRMAEKAKPVLVRSHDFLERHLNVERLLTNLESPKLPPPKIGKK